MLKKVPSPSQQYVCTVAIRKYKYINLRLLFANCLLKLHFCLFVFVLRLVLGPADYDVQATYRGPSHSFGIKLPELPIQQQGVFRLYSYVRRQKKNRIYKITRWKLFVRNETTVTCPYFDTIDHCFLKYFKCFF